MAITFHAEGVKKPQLRYRLVSEWLRQVIGRYNFIPGNLAFIFCDDEYLKSINLEYLKHDYYTDIVTFDYSESNCISGDMFISVDRVEENSVIFKCAYADELLRVIVHGLLHLLGFKDSNKEESDSMRIAENECIFMYKNIENGCIK